MTDSNEHEQEPPRLPQVYPPPAYVPPYPYGPVPYTQKNSLGIVALVLGILSLMCFGLLTGIPAIVVGRMSEKAQAQGLANNGTLGRVGWILGIAGSAIWLLIWIFYFIMNVLLVGVPLLILGGMAY